MSQTSIDSLEEETEVDDGAEIQQQPNKKTKRKKKRKKEREGTKDEFGRKLEGAKSLVLLPFKKFEKVFTKKKGRPPPPPFPYSEEIGQKGYYLCFMHPRTVTDSPPLRPNPGAKTSSYHDFLRSLIEGNDFYSPEYNVHKEK